MKGASHFQSLTSEDNIALMKSRKINKIVSEVSRFVIERPAFKAKVIF